MAMNYLGDFTTSNTVYVYFKTFDSNDPSASVTLTGLAVTDIEIYKNGSITQRSSDAGYTLLDTDGIDFDGTTGIHGFSVDLGDNTDAGFYAAGGEYVVVVASVTVDAATVNFVAASFSIERAGGALALIKAGNLGANVTQWNGSAIATPSVAGVPEVDMTHMAGGTQSVTDLKDFADAGYDPATNKVQGVVLVDTTTTNTDMVAAAPTAASNADAVWDELQFGHVTVGSFGEVATEVASILVDTDTTIPGTITTLQADTDDIQTRLPAGLVGGRMDTNVSAINNVAGAAPLLEGSISTNFSGTASGTPTTTTMISDIGVTIDDQFVGRTIIFDSDTTTAALQGQATDITACTASTNTQTFTALTTAPASGDTFQIV